MLYIISSIKRISASDGNRTRTDISVQGILSPSCLPFHHQSACREMPVFYLFVVVRGLEPLQEEPKSPMLTVTSHNNQSYDTSSHDETS